MFSRAVLLALVLEFTNPFLHPWVLLGAVFFKSLTLHYCYISYGLCLYPWWGTVQFCPTPFNQQGTVMRSNVIVKHKCTVPWPANANGSRPPRPKKNNTSERHENIFTLVMRFSREDRKGISSEAEKRIARKLDGSSHSGAISVWISP